MEIPTIPSIPAEDIASAMANVVAMARLPRRSSCARIHLVHDGKYFTKEKPTLLKEVTLIPDKPAEEADNAKLAQATKFGALLGEGTVNARSWANEQSSEAGPARSGAAVSPDLRPRQHRDLSAAGAGAVEGVAGAAGGGGERRGMSPAADRDDVHVGVSGRHHVEATTRSRSSQRWWGRACVSTRAG